MANPRIRLRIWAARRWLQHIYALCSAGALTFAGVARADEPTLAEVKYDPAEKPPAGTGGRLVLVGAALTLGWYGASLGSSYLWEDAPNARDLRLPVVGPWLSLRNVECGPRETSCGTGLLVLRTSLAVISGVGQLGGLLGITEGIFLSTGPSVASAGAMSPSARAESTQAAARPSLSLPVPVLLPDGAGVAWSGRF